MVYIVKTILKQWNVVCEGVNKRILKVMKFNSTMFNISSLGNAQENSFSASLWSKLFRLLLLNFPLLKSIPLGNTVMDNINIIKEK